VQRQSHKTSSVGVWPAQRLSEMRNSGIRGRRVLCYLIADANLQQAAKTRVFLYFFSSTYQTCEYTYFASYSHFVILISVKNSDKQCRTRKRATWKSVVFERASERENHAFIENAIAIDNQDNDRLFFNISVPNDNILRRCLFYIPRHRFLC